MVVGTRLKIKRVLLDLESRDKKRAVEELAATLKDAKEVVDFGAFLKEVFEREKLCSTGIGDGIALPHARTDAVKDFVIAFGRSGAGVEFDAIDGKPVKLIFLMGTPKEEKLGGYLRILAHLSRLLRSKSFRQSLLRAENAQTIIDAFNEAEK